VRSSRALLRRLHRRHSMLASTGLWLLTLATIQALVLAGSSSAATLGSAMPLPDGLTVTLSSISPPVAKAGQAVTVKGTVTNTGPAAVYAGSVHVLLGRQGLPLRPDVASWAAGAAGTAGTVGLIDVGRQPLGPVLSPGAGTSFSVVLPASSVRRDQAFAALPMAVTATAPDTLGGAAATLHSFLPWLGSPKRYVPVSVAWVVPVTLDPDPDLFDVDRPSRTTAWDAAVGPGSRLGHLLTALKGRPVTWAVDPAVLGRRADAGTTSGAPGSSTGKGVRTLTDELAVRLRSVTAGHPVWSLPYADPDLSAVASLSPSNRDVQSLLSAPDLLTTALGRSVRDDIAWPADGVLTAARERQLHTLYAAAPLTAAVVAAPPTNALLNTTRTAPQKSAGGLPLLAFDPGLSAELVAATSAGTTPAPASPAAPAATAVAGTVGTTPDRSAALQLFLADSMALLGELPGRARSVLVAAPRGYSPDIRATGTFWDAVTSAPWLSAVSTTDLLHQAVDVQPPRPGLGAPVIGAKAPSGALTAGSSPLTRPRLAAARTSRATVEGVSSILANPGDFRGTWLDAQDQLLSSRWRGHRREYDRLQQRIRKATDRVRGGVRVRTSAVNFFADEGLLQVSVVNELDEPVHDVHLELAPASPKLQILSQPAPLRIGSRSRGQVRVPVRAIAAGLVPVEARLSTANGTRLGTRAQMLVRVQPTGSWIYWALGGIAGVVLVAGIGRSLRRGRRPAAAGRPIDVAGVPAEPLG